MWTRLTIQVVYSVHLQDCERVLRYLSRHLESYRLRYNVIRQDSSQNKTYTFKVF